MSTAATARMSSSEVDTRNLEWKSNNIGSKLLSKMGWKEGQGIGKRRKVRAEEEGETSTEGLRVKRRAEGLGLGASANAAASYNRNTSHVSEFHNLLNDLNDLHNNNSDDNEDNNKKSKKKKNKKKLRRSSTSSSTGSSVVAFATNKSTNSKVRKAKFQEKSADDYKSIFGGADVYA
eukprot:878945_1